MMEPEECCMCGDFGLNEQLFLCTSCHQRYQHMYCSQGYPCDLSKHICNWCIVSRDRDSDRDTATPSSTASLTVNAGDGNGMRQKTTKLQGSYMDHPISPSFHNNNKKKKEKEKQMEESDGGRDKQEFGAMMLEEGKNSSHTVMKAPLESSSRVREREASMERPKTTSHSKEEKKKKKNDESKNNKAVRRYKYLLDVY